MHASTRVTSETAVYPACEGSLESLAVEETIALVATFGSTKSRGGVGGRCCRTAVAGSTAAVCITTVQLGRRNWPPSCCSWRILPRVSRVMGLVCRVWLLSLRRPLGLAFRFFKNRGLRRCRADAARLSRVKMSTVAVATRQNTPCQNFHVNLVWEPLNVNCRNS